MIRINIVFFFLLTGFGNRAPAAMCAASRPRLQPSAITAMLLLPCRPPARCAAMVTPLTPCIISVFALLVRYLLPLIIATIASFLLFFAQFLPSFLLHFVQICLLFLVFTHALVCLSSQVLPRIRSARILLLSMAGLRISVVGDETWTGSKENIQHTCSHPGCFLAAIKPN